MEFTIITQNKPCNLKLTALNQQKPTSTTAGLQPVLDTPNLYVSD